MRHSLRKSEESNLFKYWTNVIALVQLVKDLVRADRSGDWLLHVETVKKLQPIFHVFDRSNYDRWSSIYLQDIFLLPEVAPDLYEKFLEGRFTVKKPNVPFTSVGTDQALEQAINRSKKSSSGIIGSTKKKEYVAAWDLTYHECLAIQNLYRKITKIKFDNYELPCHHEFSTAEIDRSEKSVMKIIHYINNHGNPFIDGMQPLHNVISQEICSIETTNALLNIFETGCDIFEKFYQERFVTKIRSFDGSITRTNLPQFGSVHKKNNETKTNKVILKSN